MYKICGTSFEIKACGRVILVESVSGIADCDSEIRRRARAYIERRCVTAVALIRPAPH